MLVEFEQDERILLQEDGGSRYDESEDEEIEFDRIYLTNKNIIIAYQKKPKGFLSKAKSAVERISLRKIRISGGIVQVKQVYDGYYTNELQMYIIQLLRTCVKLARYLVRAVV